MNINYLKVILLVAVVGFMTTTLTCVPVEYVENGSYFRVNGTNNGTNGTGHGNRTEREVGVEETDIVASDAADENAEVMSDDYYDYDTTKKHKTTKKATKKPTTKKAKTAVTTKKPAVTTKKTAVTTKKAVVTTKKAVVTTKKTAVTTKKPVTPTKKPNGSNTIHLSGGATIAILLSCLFMANFSKH